MEEYVSKTSLKDWENEVKSRDMDDLMMRRNLLNMAIQTMHSNEEFLALHKDDPRRQPAIDDHRAKLKIVDGEINRRKRMARSGKKKIPTTVGMKPAVLKPRIQR